MTPTHATVRPLADGQRYLGRCGLCGDHSMLRPLTHFDTELPLGSQHLCERCVGHVLAADGALNGGLGSTCVLPLCRPPLGCESDGHLC